LNEVKIMEQKVNVRQVTGKQLLGTARHHAVVTDRPTEENGTDVGCTSGELLLLAIGSCGMAGLRRLFESKNMPYRDFSVDVFFEPHDVPQQRDRIVMSINMNHDLSDVDFDAIRTAAISGGVTSRMLLGSEMDIRIARN